MKMSSWCVQARFVGPWSPAFSDRHAGPAYGRLLQSSLAVQRSQHSAQSWISRHDASLAERLQLQTNNRWSASRFLFSGIELSHFCYRLSKTVSNSRPLQRATDCTFPLSCKFGQLLSGTKFCRGLFRYALCASYHSRIVRSDVFRTRSRSTRRLCVKLLN